MEQTRAITNVSYTRGAIGNVTKRTGNNGQGLEPDEGQLSRPVLRGLVSGNTHRLPGGSLLAFGIRVAAQLGKRIVRFLPHSVRGMQGNFSCCHRFDTRAVGQVVCGAPWA